MKIISEGYMTPSFLAGQKTVTRRDWVAKYAAMFHRGDVCQAYDRGPWVHGQKIGELRLVEDPYLEPLLLMPDEDYEAEGFAYLHAHPALIECKLFGDFGLQEFERWRSSGAVLYVVRFEVVDLTAYGLQLRREHEERITVSK